MRCQSCQTENPDRLYASFFQCQGDRTRTEESLGKAIEVFTECGADGWVKRTEEKLAKL